MFDVTHKKLARGTILKVLNIGQPQPIPAHVIDICLIQRGLPMTESFLESQLQYLADKGYIETQDTCFEKAENPVLTVRLKAKGIDLLERSIEDDPGIIIPRE